MTDRRIIFLGPQRRDPDLRTTLDDLVDAGAPVAVITAGWEERESELDELGQHVGRELRELALHQRALAIFGEDQELLAGVQALHDELTEQQRLYLLQLRHLGAAAQELLVREGTDVLLRDHRETAFENLQNLDARHMERVANIRARIAESLDLPRRGSLARHREEIAGLLDGTDALCVAGGHVEVLYNRLWLFDVLALVPETMPIVGWSAGAMVLSDRIVLFHDSPPEGFGFAQVLGPGFGLIPGVLPFPHARHRLRLDDVDRVKLLSRRFSDAVCLAFDKGARAEWDGHELTLGGTARRLDTDGSVVAGGV